MVPKSYPLDVLVTRFRDWYDLNPVRCVMCVSCWSALVFVGGWWAATGEGGAVSALARAVVGL